MITKIIDRTLSNCELKDLMVGDLFKFPKGKNIYLMIDNYYFDSDKDLYYVYVNVENGKVYYDQKHCGKIVIKLYGKLEVSEKEIN